MVCVWCVCRGVVCGVVCVCVVYSVYGECVVCVVYVYSVGVGCRVYVVVLCVCVCGVVYGVYVYIRRSDLGCLPISFIL